MRFAGAAYRRRLEDDLHIVPEEVHVDATSNRLIFNHVKHGKLTELSNSFSEHEKQNDAFFGNTVKTIEPLPFYGPRELGLLDGLCFKAEKDRFEYSIWYG